MNSFLVIAGAGTYPEVMVRGAKGQGVYKLEHHVPGLLDEYAQAVAMAGETAFVRGASALMMRGLIPFDPGRFYLGVTKRMRRKLPPGYAVSVVANPDIEHIEGIPVERLESALKDARNSGAVDIDRLRELEERQ